VTSFDWTSSQTNPPCWGGRHYHRFPPSPSFIRRHHSWPGGFVLHRFLQLRSPPFPLPRGFFSSFPPSLFPPFSPYPACIFFLIKLPPPIGRVFRAFSENLRWCVIFPVPVLSPEKSVNRAPRDTHKQSGTPLPARSKLRRVHFPTTRGLLENQFVKLSV